MPESGGWRPVSKSRWCTWISILILHRNVFGQMILITRRVPGSDFCTKQIFYCRRPAYQRCFLPSGVLKVQAYGHAIKIKTDGDGHHGICFDARQYSMLATKNRKDTHKLEQRSVDPHHEHRRRGEHREISFYRPQSDGGLRLYHSRGTACACGRKRSSKLVT